MVERQRGRLKEALQFRSWGDNMAERTRAF